MSEAKFQGTLITDFKAQGLVPQKFTEELASGVPDLYVAAPDCAHWLEIKWVDWPKRPATPITFGLTGPQEYFLLMHDKRPFGAGVLVGSAHGWLLIPITQYSLHDGQPAGVLQSRFRKGTVYWHDVTATLGRRQ